MDDNSKNPDSVSTSLPSLGTQSPGNASHDNETNDVQKYYNRNVWHVTSSAAKNRIESKAKQLEKISNEIMTNTESSHKEKENHKYLCEILRKIGCDVHSSYIHPTAFRAVYESGSKSTDDKSKKPTVGLICQYDAVPGFGHSGGYNLSTEASIGALIGLKAAMKADNRLKGKLVIFGTPASEENGGKIKMIKEGAFEDIDIIISVHPSTYDSLFPRFYASQKIKAIFQGMARHMDCMNTLQGHNPVDAAVLCYTNAMSISAQIQPHSRLNAIIKSGGDYGYLVPNKSELIFLVRAPNLIDLDFVNKRIVDCGEAAAQATQTKVEFQFPENELYSYLIHNNVLAKVFKEEALKVGIDYGTEPETDLILYRSTDLGNVSFRVPVIYPSFSIGTTSPAHTTQFTDDMSKPEAQTQTIRISIAITSLIIKYMLTPELQKDVKKEFDFELQQIRKSYFEKKKLKNNN